MKRLQKAIEEDGAVSTLKSGAVSLRFSGGRIALQSAAGKLTTLGHHLHKGLMEGTLYFITDFNMRIEFLFLETEKSNQKCGIRPVRHMPIRHRATGNRPVRHSGTFVIG